MKKTNVLLYKKRSAGFTLIEIIVAIGIFSALFLVLVSALINMTNTSRKAQAVRVATDNVSAAIENMSRSIRLGTSFHCGTTGDISTPQDCPFTSGGTVDGGTSIAFEKEGGDSSLSSDQMIYRYNSTFRSIERSIDGGITYTRITAPEITIDKLSFYVQGTTLADEQPRITMVVAGQTQGEAKTAVDFSIQTTVSARQPNGSIPLAVSTSQCSDRIDNDGDGKKDYDPVPGVGDPGCFGPADDDETDSSSSSTPECSDGVDNDGDGLIDFSGGDPGCSSASDNTEFNNPSPSPTCILPNTNGWVRYNLLNPSVDAPLLAGEARLPFTLNPLISRGIYEVLLQSYDAYPGRGLDTTQVNEEWSVEFTNSGSGAFSPIRGDVDAGQDLPNGESAQLVFTDFVLFSSNDEPIRRARLVHNASVSDPGYPNSVYPICMAIRPTTIGCSLDSSVPDRSLYVFTSEPKSLCACSASRRTHGPFSFNLSPGTYRVTIQGWDGHAGRGASSGSFSERFFAGLTRGAQSWYTGHLRDVPDSPDPIGDSDRITTVVSSPFTIPVGGPTDSITLIHSYADDPLVSAPWDPYTLGTPAAAGSNSSLAPLCVAFDPIPPDSNPCASGVAPTFNAGQRCPAGACTISVDSGEPFPQCTGNVYPLPGTLPNGSGCTFNVETIPDWRGIDDGCNCTAWESVECIGPPPPPPVNGACGPGAGTTVASEPTGASACSAGTYDSANPSDTATEWRWTCTGANGGTSATCSANKAPVYQCSDGIDNDGDGFRDFGSDISCSSSTDNDEFGIGSGCFVNPVFPPPADTRPDSCFGRCVQTSSFNADVGFSAGDIKPPAPSTYNLSNSSDWFISWSGVICEGAGGNSGIGKHFCSVNVGHGAGQTTAQVAVTHIPSGTVFNRSITATHEFIPTGTNCP